MKKMIIFTLYLLSVLTCFMAVPVQAAEPTPVFVREIAEATDRHIISQSFLNGIDNYQRPISRGEFALLSTNAVAAFYGFPSASASFYESYFTHHTDATGQPYDLHQYHDWPDGRGVGEVWNYILRYEYRPFSDVLSNSEVDTQIRAAQLMGLIRGRKNGGYDPDSWISREEAAVMLARIIHLYGPQMENRQPTFYSDAKKIGEWATLYVNIASNAGIMNGKADGGFHPQDLYTIEQSIVTFNRMFDLLQNALEPLCGFDISVDQAYSNVLPAFLYYKERLGPFAIVCTEEGDPMHPEDRILLFAKISEKGGVIYASTGYFVPENFRWNTEAQRLYFQDASSNKAFYLDAATMEVVSSV